MPMTYREAVKLIKKKGGTLKGHSSRHDIFEMPDGTQIVVPRRRGDLSSSVEKDIKKKVAGANE